MGEICPWLTELRDVLWELPGLPEYRRHDMLFQVFQVPLADVGRRTKDWHSGLALQALFEEHTWGRDT